MTWGWLKKMLLLLKQIQPSQKQVLSSNACSLEQQSCINGYLVGGWATPLKNMNVNWDD